MSQRQDGIDARAFYDGLGVDYDLMVSWEGRLEREKAFLGRICSDVGARSVLDAACGTGMHAAWFAHQGLRAAGADVSPVMIERARENARAAQVDVDFRVAGFGELARAFPSRFDVTTCLGNSLPHLLDDASLSAALRDFAAVTEPGGALVIQTRNYDGLLKKRTRFMPVSSRVNGQEETLFLRITDYRDQGELIDFTVVTLKKRSGAWSQSARTTPLRALRRQTMESALQAAGFTQVRVFGGYDSSPLDETASADLIITARRNEYSRTSPSMATPNLPPASPRSRFPR
ncbi:MAG TPA: class I SAM-dependent methyltransferase [Spirochaetia bacterium]|nr:class I SAM-dependent methyltransferase [Spirochaetia bacterium]